MLLTNRALCDIMCSSTLKKVLNIEGDMEMKTINCREFIDMIYGHCFGVDFSKYQLAAGVDVQKLSNEIIDLMFDNVSSTGFQLGYYLPDGVYLPSGEMVDEARKKKEEIEKLRELLKNAERSLQAALINKGPFCVVDCNDDDGDYDGNDDDCDDDDCDYDDGDYDGNDDDDCDDCDYDGDYDGDHDDNDDDDDDDY